GFRSTEPEARTFQNILTATHEGADHPLGEEVAQMGDAFRRAFNITTTDAFNPEQHDRITAYSQGLSYCVARLMFEQPEIDSVLRNNMPDLYHSFHANHDLILDFIRINPYMPQVIAAFAEARRQTAEVRQTTERRKTTESRRRTAERRQTTEARRQTTGSSYADVLQAFAHADAALNRGEDSPIPTKWY